MNISEFPDKTNIVDSRREWRLISRILFRDNKNSKRYKVYIDIKILTKIKTVLIQRANVSPRFAAGAAHVSASHSQLFQIPGRCTRLCQRMPWRFPLMAGIMLTRWHIRVNTRGTCTKRVDYSRIEFRRMRNAKTRCVHFSSPHLPTVSLQKILFFTEYAIRDTITIQKVTNFFSR